MASLLEIEGLYAGYGELNVLWDISLYIDKGEVIAILGTNGAGKTTLLKSIAGIINARKGRIIYLGEDITYTEAHERVKKGIALVPEGRQLFPHLKVSENLLMGCYVNRCRDVYDLFDMIFTMFPVLKERLNQKAGTLSGGEQQMLAIARALMSRPKLLLMDEPSQGLSPKVVQTIMDIIRKLNKDLGLSILLVEQYAQEALRVSERAYIMVSGRIVHSSLSAELLARKDLASLYLG
ncbi:MAG: ABC transporter ATP-binding protein [Sulfolobales archaeon]